MREKLLNEHNVPSHFPMQKEANPRQGFVTAEQFDNLMLHMPQHLKPLVTFLYYTGCRIGAARQIEWGWVNLALKEVHIPGRATKNGEPLVLPLVPDLVVMLKKMFQTSGPVFSTRNLKKAWKKATDDAKLSGLLVHDLRRTGVRNLRLAGVDPTVIMRISGHKTMSVFQRYNIVDSADLHEAVNRLEEAKKAGRL